MLNSPRTILLPEATRGFDRGLLSGIARYSALSGPWTLYRQPHGYMNSKRQLDLKELEAWQPDGVVCPAAQLDGLSTLRVPDSCRRSAGPEAGTSSRWRSSSTFGESASATNRSRQRLWRNRFKNATG